MNFFQKKLSETRHYLELWSRKFMDQEFAELNGLKYSKYLHDEAAEVMADKYREVRELEAIQADGKVIEFLKNKIDLFSEIIKSTEMGIRYCGSSLARRRYQETIKFYESLIKQIQNDIIKISSQE